MELAIALFITGIGIGCALHEFIITMAIQRIPHSLCDYCEWQRITKKPPRQK